MKKRERISTGAGVFLFCIAAVIEGVKTVLIMIPFFGFFINAVFITPIAYGGFMLFYASHNIPWHERAFIRFGTGVILGALPGSNLLNTAITLWGVAHDDKRYNKKQAAEEAAAVALAQQTLQRMRSQTQQ